jgi:hypothetical protein
MSLGKIQLRVIQGDSTFSLNTITEKTLSTKNTGHHITKKPAVTLA